MQISKEMMISAAKAYHSVAFGLHPHALRAALESVLSGTEPMAWLVKRYDLDGVLLDTELSFVRPQIKSTCRTDMVPLYAAPPAPTHPNALPPAVTGQAEIQPDVTAADLGANAEPEDCGDACPACGGAGRIGPLFPGGLSTICGNCTDPSPRSNADGPDALELRYREGFEDGEKHAADELALSQSYRDTYKRILDELQGRGLTPGTIDIIKERRRQIATEGWTTEHDDEHTDGSLALAAGSYCESAARPMILARKPAGAFAIPKLWPQSWSSDWWKPKSPREDLVRAAALIIAEIERLDRAAVPTRQEGGADGR